jgi:hypothetical protein
MGWIKNNPAHPVARPEGNGKNGYRMGLSESGNNKQPFIILLWVIAWHTRDDQKGFACR